LSCEKYWVGENDDSYIKFSDDITEDNFRCLCTFPFNDGEELDISRLRSLALIGVAFILRKRGDLQLPCFLPHRIPQWIIDGINKYLPEEKE
jgi:hypothetical protein